MPQLRSYTGFAQTPNLGAAVVGGYNAGTAAAKVRSDAQISREEIANRYAIASMETAAKQQALQAQVLQQAQELEVQKSIKQQQLGLEARELDAKQQNLDFVLEQGARQYQARQSMRGAVEEALKAGKTPGEALSSAGARYGTEAGAAPSMMGDIIQSGPGGVNEPIGQPQKIPILDENGKPTDQFVYRSSKNTYSPFKTEPTESKPVPGSEGRLNRFGNTNYKSPAYEDVQKLEKEASSISKALESDAYSVEREAWQRSKSESWKPSERQKESAKKYADKLTELENLKAKISSGYAAMRQLGTTSEMRGGTNPSPRRLKYNKETNSLE